MLADEPDIQAFLEYRTGGAFVLSDGDSLGSVLPAGLTELSLDLLLHATYRLQGLPDLWTAEVRLIPEPGAIALLACLLTGALSRRCRAE